MVTLRMIFIVLLLFIGTIPEAFGMVYDNRFLPLLARRVERNCMHRSSAFGDGFIMTANNAFDKGEDKDEIGLFEVFGRYDEGAMRNAVIELGFPDPFDSSALMRFQNQEILWHMNGKIASEGATRSCNFVRSAWSLSSSASTLKTYRNGFVVIN